ncbi:MAG: hypothetical protein ACRDWW_00575 [Acidimicrobiales bacterium]
MQHVNVARLEREDRPKATHAAEILVVGSDDWAIADASVRLSAAGRTVHRCSESANVPFPCNALIPGRGCPLNMHHVDVVVDIRSRPSGEPGLGEMGAVCGLRDGLPLVIAGLSEGSGLAPFGQPVPIGGDIVATCDQVVRNAI